MTKIKEFLEEQGYTHIVEKNGKICAIFRFAYSTGIVADCTEYGYEDRWCFHVHSDAVRALEEWDGIGDPKGWHRHLPSMRRRDEAGNDLGSW